MSKVDFTTIHTDKLPRIKELRELYEYKQTDVARLLGIHPRTYNGYEMGEHDVPTQVLIKLAKIYGVTVDYLLNNSDTYI